MDAVPGWDEYFMRLAETASCRSKDPATKVGAVLVDEQHRVIGMGYNGMVPGTIETKEIWERPTKYDYVIHAEANALLHATRAAKNSTLYITLFCCKDCAKLIASSGVKRVVYKDPRYDNETTRNIFKLSNIELVQL